MKSTVEVVRALGESILVQLNLGCPIKCFGDFGDLQLATTPKMDKVYIKKHGEWMSITVDSHVARLVDAYNYLLWGKARKV